MRRLQNLCLAVISVLAACASSAPQGFSSAGLPRVGGAMASKSALLYVTDEGNVVYLYTYPMGTMVGQLTMNGLQSPTGECVDNQGDVFITGYNGHTIFEYPHDVSQPIRMLADPGYPVGCSIDSTTQDLAVANAMSTGAGPGNVAIWNLAANSAPKVYSNLQFLQPAWCTYDDNGNLFVDGADYSERKSSLAELPQGAASFHKISLGISLDWPPGNVQWDEKYLTVSVGNTIYRLSVSGSRGRVVGSTQLGLSWTLSSYFIVGAQSNHLKGRMLVGTSGGKIGIFTYPAGKGPTKVITQNYPLDAVVSPSSGPFL